MGGVGANRRTSQKVSLAKWHSAPGILGRAFKLQSEFSKSVDVLNDNSELKVVILSYGFRLLIIIFYGLKLLGPSWINKTEKAFFRGRDSREERLQLVLLSKENPQLLDAGITGYFFFQEKEKELGKAKLMGFFDFFKVWIFLWLWSDTLCPLISLRYESSCCYEVIHCVQSLPNRGLEQVASVCQWTLLSDFPDRQTES